MSETNDGARVLRNCWTCGWDAKNAGGTHVCLAEDDADTMFWQDTQWWSPLCMPTDDADNCPGWKPKGQDESDVTATEKRPRKRRTCETAGCSRVSGDARFCRTCRAEAPWRAKVAGLETERDRLRDVVEHAACAGDDATFRVAMRQSAGDQLVLVVTGPADRERDMAQSVAGLLSASMALAMDERDHEIRAAEEARDAALTTVAQLTEQVGALAIERDDLTAALQVAKDHERGQAERLRRAKAEITSLRVQRDVAERKRNDWKRGHVEAIAERDSATATVRQLTEQVGALTIERDEHRTRAQAMHRRAQKAEGLVARVQSMSNYPKATPRATVRDLLDEADDLWMSEIDKGLAKSDRVAALRTRLRIMYAVAVLLGVAAGALALGGGVL